MDSCWTHNGAFSLYAVSGGEKKNVHAGLQVLSTRHCGTTGADRKEHYVHNPSHAAALNYLYGVMLVCEHAGMYSVSSSRLLG